MATSQTESNHHLSDALEVISKEANFGNEILDLDHQAMMMGRDAEAVNNALASKNSRSKARVEIVEQPASKSLRFRYECEGRSAGSIPGVNSTPDNKSYPTIKVVGYKGKAIVVVSCVTKDEPFRPHPHNLVGKEVCKRGICMVQFPDDMTYSFTNLGIQCVKKKDIEESLNIRERQQLDPFRTGFDHKRQPGSIDLNVVRLCFQVFLESGSTKGKFSYPLAPIVSDPIYDKKAMSDLVICKLSHCSAAVSGGTEVILLCEKVAKEDIQVRFFEGRENAPVWEGFGDFQPNHVHKQLAIAFRTPSYMNKYIDQPVRVFVQLRRPSDGASSEALPFEMLPLDTEDFDSLKRKRQRLNNTSPNSIVLQHLQAEANRHRVTQYNLPEFNLEPIKQEPLDRLSPYRAAVSPTLIPDRTSPQPLFQLNNLAPASAGLPNIGELNQLSRRNSPQERFADGNHHLLDLPVPSHLQGSIVQGMMQDIPTNFTLPDTSDQGAVGGEVLVNNVLDVNMQPNYLEDFQVQIMPTDGLPDLEELNISFDENLAKNLSLAEVLTLSTLDF